MPLALVYLGTKVADDVKSEIAKESMKILSEVIGKPIIYCSSQVVESVGGLQGIQKELSDRFCTLIESKTGVKGDKVYLNFTELTGGMWGFNHKTF